VPTPAPGTYRWLVRRAARVVCCSDFIRRQFLSRVDYPADRTVVIHGGVDLHRYDAYDTDASRRQRQLWGIEPDETAILFAGAVVPEKGLVELLRGLQRVRNQYPDARWRLLIAGDAGLWRTIESADDDAPDAYTSRARELSRGLPVAWLGVVPQEEMAGLYAAVDIVACPSIWDDPFPTVNVEAMAAGKPVIASRVGGVPEAVEDGATGILVDPGDDAALGAALGALITDSHRRRALGDAGRARSRLFTSTAAAARLESLYRETLECT
jgi:D-inositol-3-phosphate glycosyltransferase